MSVMYADKRRRGRLRQLVVRRWCKARGHCWSDWHPDNGQASRRCLRECGGLEIKRLDY